jgi:hypothetical protein
MINNFPAIRDLLDFSDPDKFYLLQIFKRRKDNPGMKKDISLLDSHFIYTMEQFDSMEEKIIKVCTDNNARAYFRLNRRSSKQVALKTLTKIASMIEAEDYKNVKKAYLSAAGENCKDENKTWIIDLDRNEMGEDQFDLYVNDIILKVQNLIGETNNDDTIYSMSTKNGLHLICRPFNSSKFKQQHPEIEIHNDNPTILFIP